MGSWYTTQLKTHSGYSLSDGSLLPGCPFPDPRSAHLPVCLQKPSLFSRNSDPCLLYLRSSQHSDGGHPIEAVAAHQVGNVVLDLHLLPREPSTLKQLSSGCVVVLGETYENISLYCCCCLNTEHLHVSTWRSGGHMTSEGGDAPGSPV